MQNDIHNLISAIASTDYPKQATTKIGRFNTLHLQLMHPRSNTLHIQLMHPIVINIWQGI